MLQLWNNIVEVIFPRKKKKGKKPLWNEKNDHLSCLWGRKRLTELNRIFQTPVSVILPSVEWAVSSENSPNVNNWKKSRQIGENKTFSFWSRLGIITVKYANYLAWFLVVSWGFKISFSWFIGHKSTKIPRSKMCFRLKA